MHSCKPILHAHLTPARHTPHVGRAHPHAYRHPRHPSHVSHTLHVHVHPAHSTHRSHAHTRIAVAEKLTRGSWHTAAERCRHALWYELTGMSG